MPPTESIVCKHTSHEYVPGHISTIPIIDSHTIVFLGKDHLCTATQQSSNRLGTNRILELNSGQTSLVFGSTLPTETKKNLPENELPSKRGHDYLAEI